MLVKKNVQNIPTKNIEYLEKPKKICYTKDN
jgi:hypothetical protein